MSIQQRVLGVLVLVMGMASAVRAQEYDFVKEWGEYGKGGVGTFQYPMGIALDAQGNIYVADKGNNSFLKFDSEGKHLTRWPSELWMELNYPCDVAVDPLGYIYVLNTYGQSVEKFDSQGKFAAHWGSEGEGTSQFSYPFGIDVGPSGNVYVADTKNNRIQKFDSKGKFLFSFGEKGKKEGEFRAPFDIAVDKSRNIYVVDTNNNRIQKFDSKGNFLLVWGRKGKDPGEFYAPFGITLDNKGKVYVADGGNCRIQVFDSKGKFLTEFGKPGSLPGEFYKPFGITVDREGNIYVSDTFNHRIQVFKPVTEAKIPRGATHAVPTALGARKDLKVLIREGEAMLSSFRKRLEKVSDEKVKKMIVSLGLDEAEANNLANQIKNLERGKIDYILRKVLELPLYGSASYREYRAMNLYQKLYVVLTAAEKEGSKMACLKEWLSISGETASKLAGINPETLLKR